MRLIDADALIDYCLNQKTKTVDCNDIARFPTVDPGKKGKWVGKGSEGFGIFICDNCGKLSMMEYDFCPNCGFRMEEGEK